MRSVTPNPPSTPRKFHDRIPLPHRLVKSSSNSDIDRMAAVVATPSALRTPDGMPGDHDGHYDTRTPSPSPAKRTGLGEPETVDVNGAEYMPDLSQEVSMLSTKLINAINYQTNLDDSLQHTRHELETERTNNKKLTAEKKSLEDMVVNGLLVRKGEVDRQLTKLREELATERAAREAAERAKKQTEGEVENLTSALFEEANTMVAAARRETEAAEKRSSQLRSQLNDTEMLLQSQQEQLQDLKLTMERMSERGDNDVSVTRDNSVPSTPIDRAGGFDSVHFPSDKAAPPDFCPEHPLHFFNLLHPVMRNDITAYQDFQELLHFARRAAPHSRTGSGVQQPTSSSAASSSQTNLTSALTSTSPSLPGAFSFSANSSPTSTLPSVVPPLKDTRFYKRTLSEDIEPTLRLDLAPGLTFLSRRTVQSSLLNGTLIVEPFAPQQKFYGPVYACALCGEARKKEPYVRKHRFRTSESDDAQRYPLCDYCLGRVRSTGDFVGFLRMVRDGHWRCEKEEEEKGAWEESVRLRERMFWSRLGGGVVPAIQRQMTGDRVDRQTSASQAVKSGRPSLESVPETSTRHARGTDIATPDRGTPQDDRPGSASETASSVSGAAGDRASSQQLADAANEQLRLEEEDARILDAKDVTGPMQDQRAPLTRESSSSSYEEAPLHLGASGPASGRSSGSDTMRVAEESDSSSSNVSPKRPEHHGTDSSIETMPEPSKRVSMNVPARQTLSSNNSDVSMHQSATTTAKEAGPDDRRPSAVLARVRAMEARSKGGSS